MLLDALGASLSGNLLTGKGAIAKSQGREIYWTGKGEGVLRAAEGVLRAGYGRPSQNNMDF